MDNVLKSGLYNNIVYVYQGGGALGAYQVGVTQALYENNYQPNWVVGTSIGAINASIIAGNKPEDVIDKLDQFWNKISTPNFFWAFPPLLNKGIFREIHNFLSAQMTLWLGQPGFFIPRLYNPIFNFCGYPTNLSFYDTSPLKQTLENLVDFDRINENKSAMRLSLGTVEVETGQNIYFDNTKQKLHPEHVMASCALPPGFPAIEIDGKMYWDGGIASNTPVYLVLKDQIQKTSLCFMANLFDSYGMIPRTLDGVLRRKKDINYSSQHRTFIQIHRDMHNLRWAIHNLLDELPESKRSDPKLKTIIKNSTEASIYLVRFHYRGREEDLSSKDYEFSEHSVEEHRAAGYQDVIQSIKISPWKTPIPAGEGVMVCEMCDVPVAEELRNENK